MTTMARAPIYNQGNLFSAAYDRVRNCAQCGRPIIQARRLPNGEIRSDYCDSFGRCWDCAKAGDFKDPK